MVGDGSPDLRSELVGGCDAQGHGEHPVGGDVIDHLRVGRTAFYRYFPPDRIRELGNHAVSLYVPLRKRTHPYENDN